MVGIGGGVPSAKTDIRLGDVVVSQPQQSFGGVVQYDFRKATLNGFERTGSLNSPPQILLSAVSIVQAIGMLGESTLSHHVSLLERIPTFQRSRTGPDVLFKADYNHEGGPTCEQCGANRQQVQPQRESEAEAVMHYGTIASGNQVIKNALERDRVSKELGGVLCFEMEAAGLMNNFPCLVIRGICDLPTRTSTSSGRPTRQNGSCVCEGVALSDSSGRHNGYTTGGGCYERRKQSVQRSYFHKSYL
jgi:nucleoside phosphorylase